MDVIRVIKGEQLNHLDRAERHRVKVETRKYYWNLPYLYGHYENGALRRCVPNDEWFEIVRKCHYSEYGGHYGQFRTQAKVWGCGFY